VGTTFIDRRTVREGSIICDNGFVCLRVIRSGATLELSIDTVTSDTDMTSLRYQPVSATFQVSSPEGEAMPLQFFAFDPVLVQENTRGVTLHGTLGNNPVTLTATLDPSSPWCQINCEMQLRTPVVISRFTHCWRLRPEWSDPDVHWPPRPALAQDLPGEPAAFFQVGPLFAALVADLEEGERGQLGLALNNRDKLELEYGVMAAPGQALTLQGPVRFAYALCLDDHAVPDCGFQEIVRLLGTNEALRLASVAPVSPVSGMLPALPAIPEDTLWVPFVQEGTPAEIAALVQRHFARAGEDDWQSLDAGLHWLDRLCLQQRLFASADGQPFGSVGSDPVWTDVADRMPELLLTAFRLTGHEEYAYRGIAALGALPATMAARVLGHLREAFGDIYVNPDYSETVLLTTVESFHFSMSSDTIELQIICPQRSDPLRLVLDGTQESYRLIVNGEILGRLPADTLRKGIELPI